MSAPSFTFTTNNRDLATYLYKLGYTNHTIGVQDTVKVWSFVVPNALKKTLERQKKAFQVQ